ncbi:MAG: hypothetical protein M1380_02745 [Chloroflexi bacterium]|nr:hypothetical protein [Chloroflexota bacterium]
MAVDPGQLPAGIRVLNVQLVGIVSPKKIVDAFVGIASAREDNTTFINEDLA